MKTLIALAVIAAYLALCAAASVFIYGCFNGEQALNEAEYRY